MLAAHSGARFAQRLAIWQPFDNHVKLCLAERKHTGRHSAERAPEQSLVFYKAKPLQKPIRARATMIHGCSIGAASPECPAGAS